MLFSSISCKCICIHILLQTENKYQKEQKSEKKAPAAAPDINRYDSRKEKSAKKPQIHFDASISWSREETIPPGSKPNYLKINQKTEEQYILFCLDSSCFKQEKDLDVALLRSLINPNVNNKPKTTCSGKTSQRSDDRIRNV